MFVPLPNIRTNILHSIISSISGPKYHTQTIQAFLPKCYADFDLRELHTLKVFKVRSNFFFFPFFKFFFSLHLFLFHMVDVLKRNKASSF